MRINDNPIDLWQPEWSRMRPYLVLKANGNSVFGKWNQDKVLLHHYTTDNMHVFTVHTLGIHNSLKNANI